MANARRLFVALSLPEAVRETLLDTMEGLSGARWQDADNLHITLRFIGEVDRHMFDDIVTALESVPFKPFVLQLHGVGHFQGRKRARAVWARVPETKLLSDLQYSVEMACRRAGVLAEARKFVPHVTIARLNSQSGDMGSWLSQNGTLSSGTWQVEGFSLYESHLTNQGPVYQEIARFP